MPGTQDQPKLEQKRTTVRPKLQRDHAVLDAGTSGVSSHSTTNEVAAPSALSHVHHDEGITKNSLQVDHQNIDVESLVESPSSLSISPLTLPENSNGRAGEIIGGKPGNSIDDHRLFSFPRPIGDIRGRKADSSAKTSIQSIRFSNRFRTRKSMERQSTDIEEYAPTGSKDNPSIPEQCDQDHPENDSNDPIPPVGSSRRSTAELRPISSSSKTGGQRDVPPIQMKNGHDRSEDSNKPVILPTGSGPASIEGNVSQKLVVPNESPSRENIENGALAQHELPSNVSLLTKFYSKFNRKNRVGAIRREIVTAEEGANGGGDLSAAPTAPASVPTGQLAKLCGSLSRITFDTSTNYFYHWLAIISTAYVYNLLVVIVRSVFTEMSNGSLWILWLSLDCFADSIYLVDMFVRSRTGFLEQGLLIRDSQKIFALYLRSHQFKHDLISIFPLDHVLLAVSNKKFAFLRFNRLLRRDRLQKFMEQTETRSALPNAFRVGVVVWYIAIIIHWNACFYFYISERIGLGSDGWVYGWRNEQSLPKGVPDTLMRRYIYSFYWSTLILTTIGEVPAPQMNIEYAFVTIDLMCGVLIFATIVGNVGSMISNMSAARTEFQSRIDNIKQYMELNRVGKQLEIRVIKWFDYLWANKQNLADQQVLKVLPNKLQAEIAMHVHFETLRKVRIFQDCEAGLLAELVLKLQLQVFSPMDYVCRKGDIGREMYIVKRGMIQVVSDDGGKVFATMSEGAVFGELSILNIAGSKNGNRRTANVRSVGYTDLFVLNKADLWVALREYPEARKVLIQKGRELLKKDNLLDETAPEDNKTAEEIADELQASVRILQTRIARLTAEHTSMETKLHERIAYLERKLGKYGAVLTRATYSIGPGGGMGDGSDTDD